MTIPELHSRIRSIDAGPMPVEGGMLSDNAKDPEQWPRVWIEWRGNGRWVIHDLIRVLDRSGKWVYEPSNSRRTTAFKNRTRFESIEAAFAFWLKWEAFVRSRFAAGHKWGTSSWTKSDDQALRRAVR